MTDLHALVAATRIAEFFDGLPRPWAYFLLLLPLLLVISAVYKATKLDNGALILRHALSLFIAIVAGMTAIAVVLLVIIKL